MDDFLSNFVLKDEEKELSDSKKDVMKFLKQIGVDTRFVSFFDDDGDIKLYIENLRFSKAVISENGLPGRITLVTDNFHQYRAELIANSNGIEAYNISGKTSWYLLPTYGVREWFGIVYYKLFG